MNEQNGTKRLCYSCGERPAYERGSYCGPCASKQTIANNAKRAKRQQELVVNLAKVDGFLDTISRTVFELEAAKSNDTKRYLRNVIDREVTNLGLLATEVIKAQIK